MNISASHIKANSPVGKEGKIRLSDYFPKWIFWDVDPDQLDWKEDSDYIIPRVLDWGL
jgi:hypothetical protein